MINSRYQKAKQQKISHKEGVLNTLPVQKKPASVFTILLVLYALVPTFTPQLYAWNSNGPKALLLALLNVICWIIILFHDRKAKDKTSGWKFLLHPESMFFLGLILISLLSFIKADNIYESWITLAKWVTLFISIYLLFRIFQINKDYFVQLILMFTIILLSDCLTVFISILKYIAGEIKNIEEIKSVYANKNILSAAIFIKMPFALWLILYKNDWKKWLGYAALFLSVTATFFMSTRSFYLGLILLTLVFTVFIIWIFNHKKEKQYLKILGAYSLILALGLGIFSLTQRSLYPKTIVIQSVSQNDGKELLQGTKTIKKSTTRYDVNVAERFESINSKEESTSKRLHLWSNTVKLIKGNPWLGVGLGNWQMRQLELEQPVKENHIFAAKNHNDFLEITAETGLIGGFAFAALFIFPFYYLLKKRKSFFSGEMDKSLFIPLLGLLAYSVDAFFNFPANRPEIQQLFAVFAASFICFTTDATINRISGKLLKINLKSLVVLLMLGSLYLLYINYRSLVYQEDAESDRHYQQYSNNADFFLKGFPAFPTITHIGEPIACLKCYYLWNEKRYQEAIDLLKKDKSNPYTAEIPIFLAQSYFYAGELDSSMKYAEKSISMMPMDYFNTSWACKTSDEKGNYQTSLQYINNYLKKSKTNPTAWNYKATTYIHLNKPELALAVLDTGLAYCKGDTMLLRVKAIRVKEYHNFKFKEMLDKANIWLNTRQFDLVLPVCTEIIQKDTLAYRAFELRGLALMNLKQFSKALPDFNVIIRVYPEKGLYYNDRGICLINLNQKEAACSDFKKGMDLGDANAASNYQQGCLGDGTK